MRQTSRVPAGRRGTLRTRATVIAAPLRPALALWRCGADSSDDPLPRRKRSRPASGHERRPAARPTAHPRVLVADDESAIRLLCRINLRLAGMEVLEASDGAAAIELAKRERPDLVLLDVMMPEMDGWEVAAELARDDATRDIPIVFLTARTERQDQIRGYEAGAVGYVTKPFDPLRLAPFLQDLLHRIERGEAESLRAERLRELHLPEE